MFGIQTWIFMVTDYVLYVFLARETFAGLPEYATVIGILIGTQLGQNYLYGKYDGYDTYQNRYDPEYPMEDPLDRSDDDFDLQGRDL